MLVVIIIVSRTVTVGNVELNDVVISKQIQAFIGAQIDGEVMPARFLILVYKTSRRSSAVTQRIGNRIGGANIFAIVIENERKYGVANPCGNILIGNIYPHAKFGSIFKLLLFAQVCQRGHHVAGFERVAVVDVERHGTVAAVDLAGCRCYGIYLAFGQNVVILSVTEVKHTCIAVFEIECNIRTLTEFDV